MNEPSQKFPPIGPARGPARKAQPGKGQPGGAAQGPSVDVAPAAAPGSAGIRKRHRIILVSFLLLVAAPVLIAAVYLWTIADDEYASTLAFSVRKEESTSPLELFGGLTGLSSGSTSDTDILYEYIQSQELVRRVDDRVDLREIYSRPSFDPVFTLDPEAPIEDLLDHWLRMVRISYDQSGGLIELRVLAFTPNDAQTIAQAIYDEGTSMINELSDIAREDATRYARQELDRAVERLKEAREAITNFRNRNQIVDPEADIQSQMGLLNTLNTQLAQSLIELDLLFETTRETDPRIQQAQTRIKVIEARIAEERKKLGVSTGNEGEAFSTVIGEFERLSVDREFAEQSYLSALANYEVALAEAQRKSRYLAAHIRPTLAETSEYPQREVILALIALFLTLVWSIMVLIYYSIRDRR